MQDNNEQEIQPFGLFMFIVMFAIFSMLIAGLLNTLNIGYGMTINTIIVMIAWILFGVINSIKG